jgi:hypothetical protein
MITFESFKELITSMNKTEEELGNFNKNIENIFGSDSVCMYFTPLEIIQNSIINILQNEFNESKEGAEWFVHEGFSQIKNGGTEIKDNDKEWHIKTLDDYYEFLCSLKE